MIMLTKLEALLIIVIGLGIGLFIKIFYSIYTADKTENVMKIISKTLVFILFLLLMPYLFNKLFKTLSSTKEIEENEFIVDKKEHEKFLEITKSLRFSIYFTLIILENSGEFMKSFSEKFKDKKEQKKVIIKDELSEFYYKHRGEFEYC